MGEWLYVKLKARKFFFFSYILAAVSGAVIVINLGDSEWDGTKYFEMTFSFIARFGISSSF